MNVYSLIKTGLLKVRFGGKRPSPPEHRFWSMVDKDGPIHHILGTACWLWLGRDGSFANGRYGSIKVNGKYIPSHKYSYELHFGKVSDGLLVCHRCDNRSCTNPTHLFVGSQKDNMIDMCQKGRHGIVKGEDFGHAKLTDDIVREIRSRFKPYCRKHGALAMAREFGTSAAVISYVVNGKTWRHVS